jgi:hypothetical protein
MVIDLSREDQVEVVSDHIRNVLTKIPIVYRQR